MPSVSIDGGNLGTSREEASLGGAVARFDYFGAFSHLQTDNSVPNNAYRNNTFASRFGVILGSNTNLSGTVRHIDTTFGSPNAFDYFGIADDSSQTRKTTYASVAAESQWTNRWSSTARFSVADQQYHLVNPTPTGLRSDPSDVRQLPRQPGDDHRRQRLQRQRPRDSRFRRHVSVDLRLERHAAPLRRQRRVPRGAVARHRRRRPLRERARRRGRLRPPRAATTPARSSRRARPRADIST